MEPLVIQINEAGLGVNIDLLSWRCALERNKGNSLVLGNTF